MLRYLFGFLFLYFLARFVSGLFRATARPHPSQAGRPPGEEPNPLGRAEIEDADWEEIDDGKGISP